MFRKIIIVAVLLGASLVLAGCSKEIIVDKNQNQIENQAVSDDKEREINQANSNEENSGELKNIQELLNQNKSLKCQWRLEKAEQDNDADAENVDEEASGGIEEGKFFLKEGNFFQEVEITENFRKTVIKTLKKGDWFYQWNSLVVDQGIKMPFERARNSEFLKINKIYDWNCQEFSVSEDVFEIPEEINFLNF